MQNLNSLIVTGNFELASQKLVAMTRNEIINELFPFAFQKPSLMYYAFFAYLLNQKETAEGHYILSEILVGPLCIFTDAYPLALYHVRKAVNLSQTEIGYKEFMLLFYHIPEKLLSKDEAIKISKEILEQDENNESALRLLNSLQ